MKLILGNFKTYFIDVLFHKYADFNGYSSRREFWFFNLWNAVILFVSYLIALLPLLFLFTEEGEPSAAMGIFGLVMYGIIVVYSLGVFVPLLSLTVRRLRDSGLSGWLVLLTFIIPPIPLVFGLLPPVPERR